LSSRNAVLFVVACVVALLCAAAPAIAGNPIVDLTSDPWFVNWSAALPSTYLGVNTDSSDACVAGKISCVDKEARRLERELSGLKCNHSAIFALSYARTTEEVAAYERAHPTYFADNAWLNHYDATFADFYFTAWNSWQTSKTAPAAWKIAFTAADNRTNSAAGDLLLGINAHVNRDLPFTLYAIGLVAPDGTSRKPDHDKVNKILDLVLQPLISEIAARYDPTVANPPGIPGGLLDFLEFQVLPTWRETAWRNAEKLAAAPDAAGRKAVAASIEQSAADEARSLRSLTLYTPPVTTTAARDAYCKAHLGTTTTATSLLG